MITKLRKKVFINKLQGGGVPVPYENAPLFSKQGLRQAAHTAGSYYNRLPGFIKKPINLVNPITKNPYVLGGYGLWGLTEMYKARNKPDPNMKDTSLQELGISPLADAQKTSAEFDEMMASGASIPNAPKLQPGKLPGQMIEVYEKVSQYAKDNNIPYEQAYSLLVEKVDPVTAIAPRKTQTIEEAFPGMSDSEITNRVNKTEADSGIDIAPNAEKEVIENAIKNNQMNTPPDNEHHSAGLVADNEQELVNNTQSTVADGEGVIDTSSDLIAGEIDKRDTQQKNASQLYWDNMFPQVIGSGRSAQALQLDRTVTDIMGPESKKAKNLLLLQLAANMISNRTDQPGFKGFMDVLGKSGQQVIPMALALEEQRREDELELKKALINAQNKEVDYNKLGEIKGMIEYSTPGGKIKRGPYRYDDLGSIWVTQTDSDGLNPVQINLNATNESGEQVYGVIRTMKFPDPKLIMEFNREMGMFTRALDGVNTVLDIATQDPSLIGTVGTVKRFGARGADILAQATGQLNYDDLRAQLFDIEDHIYNNLAANKSTYSDKEWKEINKATKSFLDDARNNLENIGGKGTLEQQAKIRAVQLMTSYALANILKNKDRLAVQDIKRAEQITENFGLLKSPTDVIYAYVELRNQLQNAIKQKIQGARTVGIDDTRIKTLQTEMMGPAEQRVELGNRIEKVLDGIGGNYEDLDSLLDNVLGNINVLEPQPENFEFNALKSGRN
jgi:hypothetical protein